MSLRELALDPGFKADLASLRPGRSATATAVLELRSGAARLWALSSSVQSLTAKLKWGFAGPRLRARVASAVVTPAHRFRKQLSSNSRLQGTCPLRGHGPEPVR
jgi:hypothetical protein